MRFLKKCIDHATIKYVMKTPIVPLTHHSWSFKWQGKLQRGYAVFCNEQWDPESYFYCR